MKIYINDYRHSNLLEKFPDLKIEQEGDLSTIFEIAHNLFAAGLNIMILRNPSHNIGTKKNPVIQPESISIWVDNYKFQQRG